MTAGQQSGTGAMTELDDEKGVQVDEYKDNPANHRPSSDDGAEPDVKATSEEPNKPSPKTDKP